MPSLKRYRVTRPNHGPKHLWITAAALWALFIFVGDNSLLGTSQILALIDSTSAVLAFVIGFAAIARYACKGDSTTLLLGAGFVAAGLLECAHVLDGGQWLFDPEQPAMASNDALWRSSQIFLALLMLAIAFTEYRHKISGSMVHLQARFVVPVIIVAASGVHFGTSLGIDSIGYQPATGWPDVITVFLGLGFGMALLVMLSSGSWQHNSLAYEITVAMMVLFVSPVFFATSSIAMFDAPHIITHALSLAAHACVLGGLLIELIHMAHSYKDEIELRRMAQQQLLRSTERMTRIFNYSSDAILIVNPNHDRIVDANDTAMSLLGYSMRELMENPASVIYPDATDALNKLYRDTEESGSSNSRSLYCSKKDGAITPIEISTSVVDIDNETCILCMIRDIGAQKETEAAQSRLIDLIDSNPDFIATFDMEGEILFMNRAGRISLGFDADEDLSIYTIKELFPSEETSRLLDEAIPMAFVQNSWEGEGITATMDKGVRTVTQQLVYHKSADGMSYYSITMRDIHERKLGEAHLISAKEAAARHRPGSQATRVRRHHQ